MIEDLRVYFGVYEFECDHTTITNQLGVPPTSAWNKGETYRVGFSSAVRTHSRWSLGTGLSASASVEDNLMRLVELLAPIIDRVNDVKQQFEASLVVVQHFRTANNDFSLSATCLERVSSLGLDLWFDQYYESRTS